MEGHNNVLYIKKKQVFEHLRIKIDVIYINKIIIS